MNAYGPNGLAILGTYEKIDGRAEITPDSFTRQPDGAITYEWAGDTHIFCDSQTTCTHDGLNVFLDEDGNEWSEDKIMLVEEDVDD